MSLWRWLSPLGKKPEDCPFCILASAPPESCGSKVLFQDEEIVVLVDRNPSAYRHYLVIPTNHIKTVKDLRPGEEDYSLECISYLCYLVLAVSHMYKLGKSTLLHDAPDAAKYRFGFHRPPFNSVDHLHLHCTALPYKSVWRRLKYVSVGWLGAYVSVEHVLQYLDTNKDTKTGVPLGDEPELHV
ncbi:bifunctional adenosine 5'-phosphosulfate phosphorylase/adenylylsulfatase HINT4 isoform X1 [Physcomitrium patens]|uniref:HIT domain-containing protein n=1 Tax=Physcomitrium patens TaxID=3218 RepID=A0A7I4E203_PHYPA|nr:bifunctional adenosine 5'-phosphosulfate phosphorylase/adenylylsulfatase HINT4-like isoform X1 [Physcomitrium patens]|eukprot:XP_024377931.1 bifunctional adenosine 5'-phosphosulfate phosphorylase/adenylylsulfatase HINT4-like isoform X1 [Physcomitrella patens]